MKKQKKQTLIFVILLAVMVGLYFLVEFIPKDSETYTESSEKILVMNKDDIQYVDFEGTEEYLTFRKDDSAGLWSLDGYEDRTVNTSNFSVVLSSCCNLSLEAKLENVTDYSQYGFDSPTDIVTVKTDSESHVITFGAYNTVSYVYYVMIDDDPTVYVYYHSEILPFDYETEHYLEALPEEESETTEAAEENEATEGTETESVE